MTSPIAESDKNIAGGATSTASMSPPPPDQLKSPEAGSAKAQSPPLALKSSPLEVPGAPSLREKDSPEAMEVCRLLKNIYNVLLIPNMEVSVFVSFPTLSSYLYLAVQSLNMYNLHCI